jgi:hypothetical protein
MSGCGAPGGLPLIFRFSRKDEVVHHNSVSPAAKRGTLFLVNCIEFKKNMNLRRNQELLISIASEIPIQSLRYLFHNNLLSSHLLKQNYAAIILE